MPERTYATHALIIIYLAGRQKERLEERVGRACDLEAAVEVCEALAVVLRSAA
jgi:hypothetical protein